MQKKVFSLYAIFLSAVLLCGCTSPNADISDGTTASSGQSSEISETESASETEPDVTSAAIATDGTPSMDISPITFTVYGCADLDSPIFEEITARTGVTLEPYEGDIDEMTESGELPDLLYAGERTGELAEKGLLVPLDGYVDSFGGNFSALYGDRLDLLRGEDGKLYTFGTGGSSPARFEAAGNFGIKYSVLEELGYPEIKTLEQLGDALRQYKEAHPRSTGLLLCGAPLSLWKETVSARLNYALGYPDDGEFFADNGTAVYKWTDPRAAEYVKWLNGLYNDGVLDDSSFSLRHDAYAERLNGESPAACADNDPDINLYCPLAVAFDGNTTAMLPMSEAFIPQAGIAITTSCQDSERAFRFMDWLCGDKAQLLMNFGAEGEYETAAEGDVIAEPFPMRGLTEKTADGKFYSYAAEKYAAEMPEPENKAAEAYGVTLITDILPKESELPKINRTLVKDMDIPAMSEAGILLEALETYVKTELPNAVTAPAEVFDEKWQEITDWCRENGSDRVGVLVTQLVQENMR